MEKKFLRLIGWVVLGCGVAMAPSHGAGKKRPSADELAPVVRLSPYEVNAQSMEFEHWIKISSPHFVVYTDASKKEATVLLKHMEMVHQAAQFFLRRKSLKLAPIMVVLPTGRSDWRKIQSRGGVEWKVATTLSGTARKLLLVEYDWQSDGLDSFWAMLGVQEAAAMNFDGPLWFWRGLARFFGTITFSRDSLTIGRQSYGVFWIDKYGWMDWGRFFRVTRKSATFVKDGIEHDQFESQCAVFTHYLLTHAEPVWTARLLGWAAYLEAGNEPSEEAFKAVFQEDWKTWTKRLDTMLHGGTYTLGNIRFPPAALDFPIVTNDFSPREMRELFVLAQIANQNVKESDVALDAVLERGLKTESLREVLADACERRHRPEANLEELRKIMAAGSTNPAVFSQAGGLLFHRAVAERTLDARLGAEADEIRSWCKRALELEPLYVEANNTLAWTEALAPALAKGNLETIAGICRRLDGNASTDEALAAMAVARWRSGHFKQARSICERLNGSVLCGAAVKKLATEIIARMDGAVIQNP